MKKHLNTIILIGRPNVGKSTLFNRLLGKRQAIEYQEANTTRDVIKGLVWFGKKALEVVDAAGDTKKVTELIARAAKDKRDSGLLEAAHILFVVDAQQELTAEDLRILRTIRRSGKPFTVVATKADDGQSMITYQQFGVPVYQVSAIHNLGIAELKEHLTPYAKHYDPQIVGDLIILGRPNAGKSTLFNTLAGEAASIVSSIPGTTRDVVSFLIPLKPDNKDILIRLHDTAGLTKRAKAMRGLNRYATHRIHETLKLGDCALLCMDGSSKPSTQDAHVAELAITAGLSLILVVTKWDKGTRRIFLDHDEWIGALQKQFRFAAWLPVIFVSAVDGTNIEELKELVGRGLTDRKRMLTGPELEGFLVELKKIDQRFWPVISLEQSRANPPEIVIKCKESIHESLSRQLVNRLRDDFSMGVTPIQWRLDYPLPRKRRGR